ncbi:MAG: DUF1501 domain-containing protein [Verrucomicrobiales bacterium]|nr:DUF1501 domain-containing protein [Verrucomicrobiales bacterium]
MFQHRITRRQLIGGLGGAALLSRLGRLNALAQSAPPDYKALVCIFLTGGNDGHNTVVPLTQSEFNAYRAARGSLALPDNNGALLTVETPNGTPFGLNPGLLPIHPLWAQGRLAVLANTGMLVQPVTRTQFLANAVPVPTNLFSHSDQIQQMQSGVPSTSGATGWGARAADQINGLNGTSTFPASVSITGPALFCTGKIVQSASLLPGFNLDMNGMQLWPQAAADARKAGVQQVIEFDSGLALVQAANKVRKDAVSLNAMLTGSSATIATSFPGTMLGNQMLQVAKIIKLRASTGIQRQVFFCSLGGFDTHGAQSWQHWDLLRQVSEAMAAFYEATQELGVADRVTTFTLSDFGRTLEPSGAGSDHGWGNHHLILGGAVLGGRMYGTFPTMALGGPDDSGSRGALIPTTSIDQYGATLASWFGVPSGQLLSVFPNLDKFATSNLGFLA